ncbi:MAG: hypothetical protein ABIK65_10525 [Candidatus Eisenbacteria bacterium]
MDTLFLELLGHRIRVLCGGDRIREGVLEAAFLLVRDPFDDSPDLSFDLRVRGDGDPVPDFAGWERKAESACGDFTLYGRAGESWVAVEEKSAARYDLPSGRVEGYVHPDHLEDGWVVGHRLFFIPLLEWLRDRGRFPLHGSCFRVGGRGVVVCGSSGVGKSTAALAAIAAGCPFASDDTLFLTRAGGEVLLDPFPEPVKVGRGTAAYFPEWKGRLVQKGRKFLLGEDLLPPPGRISGVRPELLLFPEIHDSDRSEFESLSPHEAMVRLLPQSVLPADRDRVEEHISLLRDLVGQVRSHRLLFGRDLRRLPYRIERFMAEVS